MFIAIVHGLPETAPPNPEEIDIDEEKHHSHDNTEQNVNLHFCFMAGSMGMYS